MLIFHKYTCWVTWTTMLIELKIGFNCLRCLLSSAHHRSTTMSTPPTLWTDAALIPCPTPPLVQPLSSLSPLLLPPPSPEVVGVVVLRFHGQPPWPGRAGKRSPWRRRATELDIFGDLKPSFSWRKIYIKPFWGSYLTSLIILVCICLIFLHDHCLSLCCT